MSVKADLEKLEVRYLANRNANLFYSLFADYTDAPEATTPRDERAAADRERRHRRAEHALRESNAASGFCCSTGSESGL